MRRRGRTARTCVSLRLPARCPREHSSRWRLSWHWGTVARYSSFEVNRTNLCPKPRDSPRSLCSSATHPNYRRETTSWSRRRNSPTTCHRSGSWPPSPSRQGLGTRPSQSPWRRSAALGFVSAWITSQLWRDAFAAAPGLFRFNAQLVLDHGVAYVTSVSRALYLNASRWSRKFGDVPHLFEASM